MPSPSLISLSGAALVCAILSTPAPGQVTRTDQTSGTTELLIAVSPVNENVVWAAGAHGTWVRTTDGGASWHTGRVPGADSLQFRDVHAVDASTAYLMSIGTGGASRVYKTTDGAQHWTLQFTNPEPKGFLDCLDFWDPSRGIVVGDAIDDQIDILTTTDGGAHWTRVPSAALPRAQPSEGSFAASGTCLVTRAGGHAWIVASNPDRGRVLHTSDYGRSWSIDTLPLTVRAGAGPQSIAFRDARHGMALGGGSSWASGDLLAATTSDGGTTWTLRTSPPLAHGVWGGVYVPGAATPTVVAVSPGGAVYSRDDGASWTVIDAFDYWSVGFASPHAGWAVGVGGRITRLSGF